MKTLFLTILLLPLALLAEDITPEKAQTLLAMKNPPQVIDIRTPEEFAKGHIKGAQLINFFGKDFEKKLVAGKLAVEGSKPLRSAFVLTTGEWNAKVV